MDGDTVDAASAQDPNDPGAHMNYAAANRAAIASYIAGGATCVGCGKLGIELEHHIVTSDGHRAVSYSQEHGIRDILTALAPAYPDRVFEGDNLIGLGREDSTITIEPAGQLEISIAPMDSLDSVKAVYEEWRSRLDAILGPWGLMAMNLGYHPTAAAPELELIPKERYRLMDAWFKTTGEHGIDMMRGTASAQVSIDYTCERDAIRKFTLANVLGPLFAFLTDDAPTFRGRPTDGRMMRTRIWDDVDPERSMVVPGLLGDGHQADHRYTFLDYADHLMTSHPILVMENGHAVSCDHLTADEVYADRLMTTDEIVHLTSMFFPDVRLKRYVEIRMADSMPIGFVLAYAALIAGIFYEHHNMTAIENMLKTYCPDLSDRSIPDAKAALERDGWTASVYGRLAYEWIDDILAMAWGGLPIDERAYLQPLLELAQHRTTLRDGYLDERAAEDVCGHARDGLGSLREAEDTFASAIRSLPENDAIGCRDMSDAMMASTAIYHDKVIDYLRVPITLTPPAYAALRRTAQTTHRILCKLIDRYREDEGYRKLFGFPEELERLVLLDTGYAQRIPIARFDLFIDRNAPLDVDGYPRFSFCEFNTDGTSAMNEDRELGRALVGTPAFRKVTAHLQLTPQTLFDPWVRALWGIWCDWREGHPDAPGIPHVAIVDYMEDATPYEFSEFKRRFDLAGIPCVICDVRDLHIRRGRLYSPDGHRIDCIYRRATTSDCMAHLDSSSALIEAAEKGLVAIVGGFCTDVAHSKKVAYVLHLPQTAAFLDAREQRFVEAHVPFTTMLVSGGSATAGATDDAARDEGTGSTLDAARQEGFSLERVRAQKDRWIIKPVDGYASNGVFAGLDVSQEEWDRLLDAHADGGYIVQEYARQYSRENIGGLLTDDREPGDLEGFAPYNEMVGLYVYDGRFAGIYTRAGRDAVIGGTHEQPTVCGLICRSH